MNFAMGVICVVLFGSIALLVFAGCLYQIDELLFSGNIKKRLSGYFE